MMRAMPGLMAATRPPVDTGAIHGLSLHQVTLELVAPPSCCFCPTISVTARGTANERTSSCGSATESQPRAPRAVSESTQMRPSRRLGTGAVGRDGATSRHGAQRSMRRNSLGCGVKGLAGLHADDAVEGIAPTSI